MAVFLIYGFNCRQTFFLPESPRWLIAHDRVDEGVHVLACLESKDATADTPAVVARRMDIQIALAAEHAAGPLRWAELWEDSITGNRRFDIHYPSWWEFL